MNYSKLENIFSVIVNKADSFIWGLPLMILLVGTGIYLTFRMKGIQWRGFVHAVKVVLGKFDDKRDPGEVSHFKALATALSATIGTGNIVGVATAILIGGPGAVFWMWVTAFVGMATKFTSCTLSVKFRKVDKHGETHGGPMHFIELGLGKKFKWLAVLFALFTVLASFGIGNMFQSNNVVTAFNTLLFGFGSEPVFLLNFLSGIVMSALVAFVIIGGIKRVAKVAGAIVPFMCVFYITGALVILLKNYHLILPGIKMIFTHAFIAPLAVQGGLIGGVIKAGVARGLFSNEAGLGSAAIAHGAARTHEPVREGLVAMLGPFIDTIVVCSITALVIVCTGAADVEQTSGRLTSMAFDIGLPGTGWIVSLGIIFFAFSTVISWSYYGDRAVDYLFGHKAIIYYRILYVVVVFLGAITNYSIIINICDAFNAMMALPNLIALICLAPLVSTLTVDYFKRMKKNR
ncbi:alanine:cation symporter family protein [bacterium]|nr:alanine:cation symporter family protein [bacterium]